MPKKLFKTKNSSKTDSDMFQDVKIKGKRASNKENGSGLISLISSVATCGLSNCICPCLWFLP